MVKHKKTVKLELFKAKYSKKIQEFIVDKIEDGLNLHEVCERYGPPNGSIIPNEKTLYRWKKKYPDFKAAIHEAYENLMFKWTEEMDTLSRTIKSLDSQYTDIESEYDKLINDNEFFAAKALMLKTASKIKDTRDGAKVRLRALEFMITRIASRFVPEFKETSANSKISELPTITIKQYITSPEPIVNEVDTQTSKTIQ